MLVSLMHNGKQRIITNFTWFVIGKESHQKQSALLLESRIDLVEGVEVRHRALLPTGRALELP